jgi:transposase-like protein
MMPQAPEVGSMAKATRRYSAKLKFQVALEALREEKSPAQIAKAYGIHANTVGVWKQLLVERGVTVFERAAATSDAELKVADLERLLGKKEAEIALLKNFLGRSE